MRNKSINKAERLAALKDQLYRGAFADLSKHTGFSKALLKKVYTGERNNDKVLKAMEEFVQLHKESLQAIELKYKKSLSQTEAQEA